MTAPAGPVLVTGALGGLGSAIVAELASRGTDVAAVDRQAAFDTASAPPAEQIGTGAQRAATEGTGTQGGGTEGTATQGTGTVRRYAADAADPVSLSAAVDAAEADLGPLAAVYANAGIGGGGGIEAPDEVWDACWQVNVMAHVYLARRVVPGMLERGRGTFVSVASAAGLLTNLGNAPYSVTKHAAVAFAEWLAVTYGDAGLAVHLVAPMGIDTPMLRSGLGTLEGESVRALGVIEPAEAARRIVAGVASGHFLVLTHPQVADFERHRAADRDRWLTGMRRARDAVLASLPPDHS